MQLNRRSFLGLSCLTTSFVMNVTAARAQITPRVPNPATLRSGDFLWPKKPGEIIPFHGGTERPPDNDREAWLRERDEFLESIKGDISSDASALRSRLSNMTYDDFRHQYFEDETPGSMTQFSAGIAGVGHVAIVDRDARGALSIIEATLASGVSRSPYTNWLSSRAGNIIWHGRLKNHSDADRSKIATESARHIGKPYRFFDFNLNHDTGFYCSKLVWLSVFRSLNMAVDGNMSPVRSFWLSPKQVLYSSSIALLLDQGAFGDR